MLACLLVLAWGTTAAQQQQQQQQQQQVFEGESWRLADRVAVDDDGTAAVRSLHPAPCIFGERVNLEKY